jgi:hypothetical protein
MQTIGLVGAGQKGIGIAHVSSLFKRNDPGTHLNRPKAGKGEPCQPEFNAPRSYPQLASASVQTISPSRQE